MRNWFLQMEGLKKSNFAELFLRIWCPKKNLLNIFLGWEITRTCTSFGWVLWMFYSRQKKLWIKLDSHTWLQQDSNPQTFSQTSHCVCLSSWVFFCEINSGSSCLITVLLSLCMAPVSSKSSLTFRQLHSVYNSIRHSLQSLLTGRHFWYWCCSCNMKFKLPAMNP